MGCEIRDHGNPSQCWFGLKTALKSYNIDIVVYRSLTLPPLQSSKQSHYSLIHLTIRYLLQLLDP